MGRGGLWEAYTAHPPSLAMTQAAEARVFMPTSCVDLKRDKPHWGARKIRELLVRKLAGDVRLPANSVAQAGLRCIRSWRSRIYRPGERTLQTIDNSLDTKLSPMS